MSSGNGEPQFPIEILDAWRHAPPGEPIYYPMPGAEARTRRSLSIAIVLFVVTVFSTLAVGAQFAADYALNRTLGYDGFFDPYVRIFHHPSVLLAGIPFSFTLLGILLAHELGHFFACRYYGMAATYPYFIPAPTLIGTLGAFIRIRAPIINRKALFDVGIAGPVVGFLFAVPALAAAIVYSKVVPAGPANAPVVFGNPILVHLLTAWLRPGVRAADILLHPVGRAAWVGLFATALNLLPAGQLDGGHILYAIASRRHRLVSLIVAVLLFPLGRYFWSGWYLWAGLLLAFGFRHAPLVDPWTPIDTKRRVWAAIALAIFLLCFMPSPFRFTD
jgi:membrane-associated protease RseP (regulator of RpoE activity)